MTLDALLAQGRTIILDGAMGTELERRGFRTELPLWSAMANVSAPGLVTSIHRDYLNAGADILTANTFRTTAYTFKKISSGVDAARMTKKAIDIARMVARQSGRKVVIAASIAPLEDCYHPELLPEQTIMEQALSEQIDLLIECQPDCILAETMINFAEAEYIAAFLDRRQFPFMLSFTTNGGETLLDGTPLSDAVSTIARYAPRAILLNCRPIQSIGAGLGVIARHFDGPAGVYANGPGRPDPVLGWELAPGSDRHYAEAAKEWLRQGARIIGGCCGTTPKTIRTIRALVRIGNW